MKLSTRFFLYFLGVGIGIFILTISLNGRELNFPWWPESRVKSKLIKNDILILDSVISKMLFYGLEKTHINQYILQSDVNFQKSSVTGLIRTSCNKYNLSLDSINFILSACPDSCTEDSSIVRLIDVCKQ
tara:strand:- start:892 stop:1281 length:390 start_codon:yes stop_codon:yes gene_type:complete